MGIAIDVFHHEAFVMSIQIEKDPILRPFLCIADAGILV
jgi:hypothetical protein